MSEVSTVTVTVPATTANLGPGFDCIGAALTLYNRFEFSLLPPEAEQPFVIEVTGLEAERVKTDESNLAYQSFAYFYQQLGKPTPRIHMGLELGYPLARGLGSSATAIVGGLVGANAIAGSPLSQEAIMAMAIALEGHPDNVVPALIGGCRLAASNPDGSWTICEVPWHETVIPVIAIPDFELSTTEARRVLPSEYSRADAIFNMAHLGLLLRGLQTGEANWLRTALQDRIHQPYRRDLIQAYESVEVAALNAGAYGMVISGAGPTLLALTSADRASAVELAMTETWQTAGIQAQGATLRLDGRGAIIAE